MASVSYETYWLEWPDCLNVRDVGGLPTASGGTVRRGALIRADALDKLTETGIEAFRAAGVSRIVDLRRSAEAQAIPHPFAQDEIYQNIPVQNPADPDHEWLSLAEIYVAMLDLRPTFFAKVMSAIADAPAGAVVVHCAGGKDRTGVITAMALSIAGVEDPVIAADYALSEERLREANVAFLETIPDADMRERLRILQPTPPENMVAVLDHLNNKYGGVEEYLRSGGVSDAQLQAVRSRLVA